MSTSCLETGPGDLRNDQLRRSAMRLCLCVFALAAALATDLGAAESAGRRFDVRAYALKYDPSVFSNAPAPALSRYTGTNISVDRIVEAASEVLWEYRQRGYSRANLSMAQERITNGIVTMHLYQGLYPQVLISGQHCFSSSNAAVAAITAAGARAAGIAVAKTNESPRFNVRAYEIRGDTLLSTNALMSIFAKHTGTNVSLEDIAQAASGLQMEYRNRGYPTVSVTLPQQQLTNGMVKIRVFEGRLSEINVSQNRYFSSNNVRRALPSLHTNMLLNSTLFQAELDRANANQDRQIYPRLDPGAEENTTALDLQVKDRLPLHAKLELNNQSSPGTPDLRVNTSAAYNNLWQLDHSAGVQYSFSPEAFKQGNQWDFYDVPMVANYSAFYRLPLGNPGSISEAGASQPGTFGYDEATHKFRLPPASGRPELSVYASRSSIDTGLMTLSDRLLTPVTNDVIKIRRQDLQRDLTINESAGFRLSQPLASDGGLRSSVSGGADVKSYDLTSYKTNLFTFTTIIRDKNNQPVGTNTGTTPSPVAPTHRSLDYLPLALRYDGSLSDSRGSTMFGLGVGFNAWYEASGPYSGTNTLFKSNVIHGVEALRGITGSSQSSGHWFTLNPSLSRNFSFFTNWVTSVRADGQWASEPLISNEQYGLGGLNTIRGYQEGDVFGDTGWHVSLEQGTPTHVVGFAYAKNPLALRGTVFMDYGRAYLLDPQGRPGHTSLWGAGFGGVATLGAIWEARFFFSWPLLTAGTGQADEPRFDFSLSAQF